MEDEKSSNDNKIMEKREKGKSSSSSQRSCTSYCHRNSAQKMQLNILITERKTFSSFPNMIRENSHQITQFSLIMDNEVFDVQALQVDIPSFV
jgi:hypothetical protein